MGVAMEEAFALKVRSSKRPFQPARRLGPVVAATVLNLDRRDWHGLRKHRATLAALHGGVRADWRDARAFRLYSAGCEAASPASHVRTGGNRRREPRKPQAQGEGRNSATQKLPEPPTSQVTTASALNATARQQVCAASLRLNHADQARNAPGGAIAKVAMLNWRRRRTTGASLIFMATKCGSERWSVLKKSAVVALRRWP